MHIQMPKMLWRNSLRSYSNILNKHGARLSADWAVRRLLRTAFQNRPVAYYEPPTREFRFVFETLSGRLPPEQNSDRRETLAKRVSDDLQYFIFRR